MKPPKRSPKDEKPQKKKIAGKRGNDQNSNILSNPIIFFVLRENKAIAAVHFGYTLSMHAFDLV